MQQNWQSALKDVITSPAELLDVLGLNSSLLSAAERSAKLFPLRVPRGFVSRMQKGNPDDPLLRQILPLVEEETIVPGFSPDPLNETSTNPIPGLLHKYNGRVLILVAGACAINCRYCFRRHFPYQENISGGKSWAAILDYIAADPSIYEVIFSGGDPLLANDKYLEKCIHDLAAIAHLKTLRIHSRLPIVLPQRITADFATILTATHLQAIMVIHCNHANELDDSVAIAIDYLRQKKIVVLNQSVLLRGVNDSVQTLIELSQRLFALGVLPYYLNLLDKVQGAAHFEVNEKHAKSLVKGMREKLSGYLVPRLVKEQAGAAFKLPLF
ncbi:lysine 2 3-aminomutase [Candidatus Rickettsiella viridis]|uniref:L-lysine 2,3-aminomutase n=1 Tax=Candidatus Rickettsiella viridis TaxID=676208 RepID=A0A2Z5UVS3_9COXI|nr:EF-P beta-lysylation protein EpmB [Candidatus Rickettsiella viridis]BBB15073.1 lysine 2 3-aminomutase [Candidatus Rickettsiella viridis]